MPYFKARGIKMSLRDQGERDRDERDRDEKDRDEKDRDESLFLLCWVYIVLIL
jgi:hypothetical protein